REHPDSIKKGEMSECEREHRDHGEEQQPTDERHSDHRRTERRLSPPLRAVTSRDRKDRDDLLLVMRVVGAVVVCRDGCRVALSTARGDTEVVADEGVAARRT